MMGPYDRRTRGNAVAVVLLVLCLIGAVLGVNYARNYQIDKKDEKNNRPYARYPAADLEVLAEGYRIELASAEERYRGSRVQTRQRHHFNDRIQEFERVQREARKARDKALDVAKTRQGLEAIQAEQQRRSAAAKGAAIHLARMFRL